MMKKILACLIVAALLPLISGCTYLITGGLMNRVGAEQTPVSEDGETVTLSKAEYEGLKRFQKLSDMLDTVNQNYYIDFDQEKLLTEAARGLLYGLADPYSFYYSPEEYKRMWEEDEGKYAGVGIQILTSSETLLCTVSRVFKDSPAQAAGIHKGDTLLQVEDLAVNAYSLQEAVDIMRGTVGEPVSIKVQRGEEVLDFTVKRAQIKVNWVEYAMLENNIGYISLYEFAGDCSIAFADALNALTDQGAAGIILDLRDNPGGWVDDAVRIADMFLDEGVIYYLEYRNGEREYVHTKSGAVDTKLVVLVNENSASASEVMTGALQDRGRATIVGTQSFGKGVVQYVVPVSEDGSGMQFTAAQYFTPDGNKVHGVGITPDVVSEMPEEDRAKIFEFGDMSDTQLKKAYEVITK